MEKKIYNYSLSERLWNKVQESFHISQLFNSKPKTFEQLYEVDPEDLNILLNEIKQWSPDNVYLYDEIQTNGYSRSICNKQFIGELYQILMFQKEDIISFDEESKILIQLKVLNLDNNRISTIENLPHNLRELYLYRNFVNSIKLKIPHENLIFLGLGYNNVNDEFLDLISKQLPNLLSLDLCFNCIIKLEETVENLVRLRNLKMLVLFGNPIILIKQYKDYVLSNLKLLKYFDHEQLINKSSKKEINNSPINNSFKKQFSVTSEINNSQAEAFVFSTPTSAIKFQIIIKTLENIVGIILDNPDSTINSSAYQSSYWLEFSFGEININTKENKILFESNTTENEKSRIDFEFNLVEDLLITEGLKEAFKKNFIIKIWRSQPIITINEETQEKITKLREDGKPELEEDIWLIGRINLSNWLTANPIKKIQTKLNLFDKKILEIFEFNNPVENEEYLINKYYVEPTIEKNEEEEKKDKKKDTKQPPPKKDQKKEAKKPLKKGEKEPEKKIIPILDWPKDSREKVYIDEKTILNCIKDVTLSIQLEII